MCSTRSTSAGDPSSASHMFFRALTKYAIFLAEVTLADNLVGVKLDAGTDERIMLVSRDEQSVLVVSYKDVKACIASAFAYVSLQCLSVALRLKELFLFLFRRDLSKG